MRGNMSKETKRIKVSATTKISTRAEAELKLGEIAQLKLNSRRLAVVMDQQINAIREKYQPSLDAMAAELEAITEGLRAWADANQAEFGKLRSLKTTLGRMGWRVGMPKLKTLSGVKWEAVMARLKTDAPEYVRTKEEIDKEGIIANRERLGAELLKSLGVRVVQDETFYVEPELTDIEAKQEAA